MWLVRGTDVLASLEVASSRGDRRRGLLGRDGLDGAFLIERCRSVHSLGMRFALDVAYLDAERVVLHVARMPPWRLAAPVWAARSVLEAEAGMFERWHLGVGDELIVSETNR